jgi:ATP-binding cassette, subfamily B, bacterial
VTEPHHGAEPATTATPASVSVDGTGYARRGFDLHRLPRLLLQALALVWEATGARLAWLTGLQLVSGAALAAQLLVLKRLLDVLTAGGDAGLADLLPALAAFVALLVVTAATGLATAEQQRILGQMVERHTTGMVMDVATGVELLDYDRPEFYDRLQRARVSATGRPVQMTSGLLGLANSGIAVVAIGATLLWLEPLILALVVAGFLPTWWLNRVAARAFHAYAVRYTPGDRRRAYLYDILTRKTEAHEIRAFDSAAYLRSEHDRLFDDKIVALRAVARRRLLLGLVGAAASALAVGATLALLLVFMATGRMDLAVAGTAVGGVVLLSGRLRAMVGASSSLYEGSLFLEDFLDFVADHAPHNQPSNGRAGPDQADAAEPDSGSARHRTFGEIELDGVGFTYPSRREPSLQGISTRLRQGEVVALVGENGSGKTTLAKLLAGLYHPDRGTVRWDGVDLATIGLEEVRDQVAVIFQDYARYWLTAADNVGIGAPQNARQRDRVDGAAAEAGAKGFIAALPDGYETLLGPAFVGGSDLSGGQWQRLALARAYFRDAPLLILDEPTASLDPRGEYEVFQQVRRLAAGRTVVLISHRFSSARAADRILVLDGGRLVEEGPHDELVARGGLYAELFSLQAASYGLRIGS